MLDRSMIRENLDSVQERLKCKGFELDQEAFLKLDQEERSVRQEWEEARGLRNKSNEEIAEMKKLGEDAGEKIAEMKEVSGRIKELDEKNTDLQNQNDELEERIERLEDIILKMETKQKRRRLTFVSANRFGRALSKFLALL